MQKDGRNNEQVLGFGGVHFGMGKHCTVTPAQLTNLQNGVYPGDDNSTELERILHSSSMIFAADGSHSRIRGQIFNDLVT